VAWWIEISELKRMSRITARMARIGHDALILAYRSFSASLPLSSTSSSALKLSFLPR